MRERNFFVRTGFAVLFMLLTAVFAFGQTQVPNPNTFEDTPLDVEVMISRTITGDYFLFAFCPGEPLGYFASNPKRFRVKWYNPKGKLVAERAFMVSECGKKYIVTVEDVMLRKRVSTVCETPACHNPNASATGITTEVPEFR